MKRVSFAVPPQQQGAYAVQLRLTPALLEALLGAEGTGQNANIRFGEGAQGNCITIGGSTFRFNALPEETCDLLHLAPEGGAAPAVVAAVRQKLMVQRNIADERERVRARAEEAERRGSERKALLLDGRPGPKAGKPGPVVRRVTPPPMPSRATPPPQPAAAPPAVQQRQQPPPTVPTAPAGRPPAHPGSAARGATPPPPAAAPPPPRPMHKSASTGKLGSRVGSAAGSQGSLQASASPLAQRLARSGASLRHILIAVLSERQMGIGAVKATLGNLASCVRSFKAPSKDQLERALKAVAEFKSPGLYVVYPVLLKELDELAPGGSSPPPPSTDAASPKGDGSGGRGRKRRASSAAPAPAPPAADEGAAAGAAAARPAGGGKRARLDSWTDDDDSDGVGGAHAGPAVQPQQQQQQQQAAATAPSPPSVGPGGASSGSAGGVAAAARRRTSSSRGSDHADDSWIEEHADRQPQPAAPIASREEYEERAAAFNAKYETYFALHQLIEAHKKDFEALAAAMRGAASPAEEARLAAEVEALQRRRGGRAQRWDSAYKVLHQELSAAKARMAEFVRQLQRQQQQQQQHSNGSGPASAATAVRVK